MILETNLDDSFPLWQFYIDGFDTPIRLDCNKNVGGIMIFVREDVPAKLSSSETAPIKGYYVEMNLYKEMASWLLLQSWKTKHR